MTTMFAHIHVLPSPDTMQTMAKSIDSIIQMCLNCAVNVVTPLMTITIFDLEQETSR